MINRSELKGRSGKLIMESWKKVFAAAAVYVVVLYILSFLEEKLTGN